MVRQEHLSVSERQDWERVPLEAYRKNADGKSSVATTVADQIERNLWLEESAQPWIERIRALVHAMGNIEEWQVAMLEEAIRQIRERRPMKYLATRSDKSFYGIKQPETFKLFPNLRDAGVSSSL